MLILGRRLAGRVYYDGVDGYLARVQLESEFGNGPGDAVFHAVFGRFGLGHFQANVVLSVQPGFIGHRGFDHA